LLIFELMGCILFLHWLFLNQHLHLYSNQNFLQEYSLARVSDPIECPIQ
jgi:hypothetical protein